MDLLYKYSIYLSMYYANSTKDTYLEQVKLYLDFLKEQKGAMNHIILYNTTKKDIYNYLAFISEKQKGTMKVKIFAIKNFYSYINKDLSDFLFEDIKLFNTYTKLPKSLTSCEIEQLLKYYGGEKRDIIFLFLNLGIRLSEMTNLDFTKINYKENYFTILQKGNRQRIVYFNDDVKQVLQKYNSFSYSNRQIQYFISSAMKRLGIKGSVHTLRHTFATFMYKETKDILVVKELLGHSSIESTMIYTHIENENIKKAYESNPLANFKIGGGK